MDRLLFEVDRRQLNTQGRRCLESVAHAMRLGFEGRAGAALTRLASVRASEFWPQSPGSMRREVLSPDETLERLRR